jgi:iron complex outermembrane recepter protein
VDKVIARNNSAVAAALGIPKLQEETSRSAGLGITFRSVEFSLAIDGYLVDIDNRIVLTGAFEATDPDIGDALAVLGVGAAQFFTNAIDTRSRGIDIVASHQLYIADHRLRLSLAANFNDMELGAVHTNDRLAGKEDTYFGAREQAFLVASAPDSKVSATLDHNFGRLDSELRVTRFGEVRFIDWLDTDDVYRARATTDLSVGYRMSDRLRITIGSANLFNVYPTQQDTETESGGVWDAVQMGFSGAFYFARLSVKL